MSTTSLPGPTVVALGRQVESHVELLGTAFFVQEGRFATTSHVVGGADQNLVLVVGPPEQDGFQDTTNSNVRMIPAQIHAADPYRDLCVLSIDGIQGMLPPLIASADDLSPGEPVVLFGYPHANAGRHVLTRQTADVGARVLLSAGPGTSKNVVLNIQAQPGQSGSPVISAVTGRIAAVLVGSFVPGSGGGIRLGTIDPMTLHQTTHAVSAHYIQEMI